MALKNLPGSSSARLLILTAVVFAAISVLMIPAYFIALRPRRGTTEWMKRLDKPEFAPLTGAPLSWLDGLWVVLAGVSAGAMQLLNVVFLYIHLNLMEMLPNVLSSLALYRLLPGAILGAVLYLLLRSMNGRVLPALLGAVLGGLVQFDDIWFTAVITLSLMLLWFWAAAPADRPMFPGGLLFLGSLACYGLAVYFNWAVFWLAPVYLAAYLYVVIRRWKYGPRKNRGISLTVSILLLLLTAVAAAIASWVLYCLLHDMGSRILDLPWFFERMSEKFTIRMQNLVQNQNVLGRVFVSDIYPAVLGITALVPVFHGIFKRRDSRCIVLAALLLPFTAVWLLGGTYLMVPFFILLAGWVWNVLAEREHSWLAGGFAAVTAVFFLLQDFI